MTLATKPVTARMMLTAAPMPTERKGLTFGSVVLKLFAAINDEKQAGGKAGTANRNMTHFAVSCPRIAGIKSNELRLAPFEAPATITRESPAVTKMARAM